MRGLGWTAVVLAAGVLWSAPSGWALGSGAGLGGRGLGFGNGRGYWREEHGKHFKPGADASLDWKNLDFPSCAKARKPILLYVYDATMKSSNHTARYFEENIFPKEPLRLAALNFTCVKIAKGDERWPAALRNRAAKGAALFLMTCDGAVHAAWRKDFRPTAYEVIHRAKKVLSRNPKAIARVNAKKKAANRKK